MCRLSILIQLLLFLCGLLEFAHSLASGAGRAFYEKPKQVEKPRLILIAGSPGTGKSTFGMAAALDQGILKCISTDTMRAVMRSYIGDEVSPALHRSSYAAAFEGDDPVRSWMETCTCLSTSVEDIVQDAIDRQVSLVLEGVHIVPSKKLIDKWKDSGGVAIGVLLKIDEPEKHKAQLQRRGFTTGQMSNENKKIKSYDRIRAIQAEMIRLADKNDWIQIEQNGDIDPLEAMTRALERNEMDYSSYDKNTFAGSIRAHYKLRQLRYEKV